MDLPSFDVERRSEHGVEVLAPSGRITLGASVREMRRLFDELAEEAHKRVVLNMAKVPYIDSAGLGTLITGLTLLKKNNGTLVLSNLQPRVAQLLELTNLTGVIKSFPAEDAALRSLNEDTERTVS